MGRQEIRLNDNTIRLMGIPSFGIIIPMVTGLFGDLSWRDPMYWAGFFYFIVLAALIWQGNRYLLFRTRKRFTWFDKPIEKLILLFMNNIFYTTPLTIAWICLWYRWTGSQAIHWDTVLVVTLINVICVLFVTHVYETVFMVKEQEGEQLRSAELSRAKAEAELAALKNQIDPHFMFNSLNTLIHLIKTDPSRAFDFTENLAEVYRYILSQKDQSLVLLEDELDFTHKYTDLLHLRFGKALVIRKNFHGMPEKNFLIPPTSVFVAFENAVKHNEIGEHLPLHIDVDVNDGYLVVGNIIQEKKTLGHSSRIGLKNLEERFKIVTGRGIITERLEDRFVVRMPLIPLNTTA
ncbi:MAG TPA: histidine kinase [Ohtaekwangia sp.]|nr:histidine kinase [Ohtaekwangia sp.]